MEYFQMNVRDSKRCHSVKRWGSFTLPGENGTEEGKEGNESDPCMVLTFSGKRLQEIEKLFP